MKNIPLLLLILSLCISCNLSPNDSSNKEEIYTYKEATVYAGSTDYFFMDSNNERVVVQVSNFEEAQDDKVIVPDNMLESGENLEGPPAENTKLVGRKFTVIRNEKGEIRELKLKQ